MTGWLQDYVSYLGVLIGEEAGRLAVKTIPSRPLYRLSDAVAETAFRLARGFRRRSLRNLEIAFGDNLDRPAMEGIARRSMRSFCRACVELTVALESSPDQFRARIPLVGREHLEAAAARGRGVIALGAHVGNFLLAGSRLTVEGYPASVLVNQPSETRRGRLLDAYRLRLWQRTIHARPQRDALRALTEVLRKNDVAVMIADEYRGTGVPVTLFGRPVLARQGVVTLALRTGAAVVPVCLVRRPDDTLVLIVEPELVLDRSGSGPERIKDNTQRMTRWVERTVRAYPDQWNWMNIRWADPAGREPAGDAGDDEAAPGERLPADPAGSATPPTREAERRP
jgi:KDO2-lipid IV(A) lauroyltransferase